MNLRKLLCGLLALSLLLTMVPMAFMEEAPVGESVVEIGEIADAEALPAVGPNDEIADDEFYSNLDLTLNLGGSKKVPFEYEVKKVESDNRQVATATKNGKTVTVKASAVKDGEATITVTMKSQVNGDYLRGIINVIVKNPKAVNAVRLLDEDGLVINGETIKVELGKNKFVASAEVRNKNGDVMAPGAAGYGKLVLESSDPAIAEIDRDKAYAENFNVKLNKKGTVKISAYVRGEKPVATFTLKIVDNNTPKKVTPKVVTDDDYVYELDDGTYVVGLKAKDNMIFLFAEADPVSAMHNVTWSLKSTKYASFLKEGKRVDTIKTGDYQQKVNGVKSARVPGANESGLVFLSIRDEVKGTVTIEVTAKTYNNKSKTIKIKLLKLDSAKKLSIHPFLGYDEDSGKAVLGEALNGQRAFELRLYAPGIKFKDYDDSYYATVDRKMTVVGVLWSYVKNDQGQLVQVKAATSKDAITWKSSNKSVATIAKDAFDPDFATITAKKVGKTTITMEANGKKQTFELKVVDKTIPDSIYFVDEKYVRTKKVEVTVDRKIGLNVMANYADMSAFIAYDKLSFKSHNTKIATVDKNGVVYGKKAGTTHVTVKYKGKSAKITIKVVKK